MSTTDPSNNMPVGSELAGRGYQTGPPLQEDQTAHFLTPGISEQSEPQKSQEGSVPHSGNQCEEIVADDQKTFSPGLSHSHKPTEKLPPGSIELLDATTSVTVNYPDRYDRQSELGRGGWGVVDRAHDRQLERDVAIKRIIIPDDASEDVKQRFLHEAKITSQLQHPGVVPVHELIEGNGDQSTFYVMKLLEGDTLRDQIRLHHGISSPKKPVPQLTPPSTSHDLLERITPLLDRFIDVCNAVAYAHQREVIHRDLKPTNIMVGAFGETIVVDWGLAVHENKTNQEEQTITGGSAHSRKTATGVSESDGTVIGTPAYMSPEQARGELLSLGPSSDIYSLGIMLWEIVVGKHPYRGDSVDKILSDVCDAKRPCIKQQQPLIAKQLVAIIEKAIAANPNDRYETATDLANDVRQFMLGEKVSVYDESLLDRTARWCRRNRSLVTTIAVSTVGLLVASIVFGYLITLSRNAELAAKQSANAAHRSSLNRLIEARDSADTWLIDLSGSLQFYPGLNPIREQLLLDAIHQYKGIVATTLREKESDLSATDEMIRAMTDLEYARCHLRLGDLYFLINEKENSKNHFQTAAKILSSLAKTHPPTLDVEFAENGAVGIAQWVRFEQTNSALGMVFHDPEILSSEGFRNHRRWLQIFVPDDDELSDVKPTEAVSVSKFRKKAIAAAVRLEMVAHRFDNQERPIELTTAKLSRAAAWSRWLSFVESTPGNRRLSQTTQEELARYLQKTQQTDCAKVVWEKLVADLNQWISTENPRPDQLQSLAHARLMSLSINRSDSNAENAYRSAIGELNRAWRLADSDSFYRTNLASAEYGLAKIIIGDGDLRRSPEKSNEALTLLRQSLATYQELLRENVSLDNLRHLAQTHHSLCQLLTQIHPEPKSPSVSPGLNHHLTSGDAAYQMIYDHGALEISDALNWYELSVFGNCASDNDPTLEPSNEKEKLQVLDHWLEGQELNSQQVLRWEQIRKTINSQ